MKIIIDGFIVAFSMYSIIPMPQRNFDKKTMRYAMCFFPFVGVIIGIIVYLLSILALKFNMNGLLFSAILTLIPIIISGAIHLDGLIDTSDALYSRLDKERKLEILKDPHVGAFGVILCVGYMLLTFGLFGQLYNNPKYILILSLGYILSRGCSSLAIVTMKTAKNSGLAHIFSDNADKKVVKISSVIYILLSIILMMMINLIIGIVCAITVVLYFIIFKKMCYKKFGGLTGDLAGYLLCIIELIVLIIVAVGGMI